MWLLCDTGPACVYLPAAACDASITQKSLPTAAAVIDTDPAAVTEQPTLPAPSANVIAPRLFELAYVKPPNAPSTNIFAGNVGKSKTKFGVAFAMWKLC